MCHFSGKTSTTHDLLGLTEERSSALVLDHSLSAEIRYDTQDHLIYGSLRAIREATLADLINGFLPENMKSIDLLPAVAGMVLDEAGVGVDPEDDKLDRFDINLNRHNKLYIEGTSKAFQLNSVTVSYRRGKTKENGNKTSSPAPSGGNRESKSVVSDSTNPQSSASQQPAPPQPRKSPVAPGVKDIVKTESEGEEPNTSTVEASLINPSGTEIVAPWSKNNEYPEASTLIVSGTAQINSKNIRVSFGYQSG